MSGKLSGSREVPEIHPGPPRVYELPNRIQEG